MASNGGRLHEIEARARGALEREPSDAAYYERQYGPQDGRRFECEVSEAFLESLERVRDLDAALRDLLDNLGGHSHWREGGSGGTCETCVRQGDAALRARAVLAGETAGEPKREYVCPECRVERADYEGPNGAWLPTCPNCGSEAAPSAVSSPGRSER